MRTFLCSIALASAAAPALADDAAPPAVTVGGYLQPQLRLRQDSTAQADEDGFRVRRARLTAHAGRAFDDVEVSVDLEGELTPNFSLLDAYLTAQAPLAGLGRWRIDAGQVKAPVSRETLLSDSRLGFVEKPELASLAPDRQIGVLGKLELPGVPFVWVSAGVFNGEGRNQGGNVDQHVLYAGRFEVRPFGREVKLSESGFDGDFVAVAASGARQRQDTGDGVDDQTTIGGDVAFAYRGLSGEAEMIWVHHDLHDSVLPDYHASGVSAQVAYLLPVLDRRLELGVRYEEIDRNDQVPIVRPGDDNQSLRYLTGAVNWYQHGHQLKVQSSFSHIVEIEDRDAGGMAAGYANDTLLVQATYRME